MKLILIVLSVFLLSCFATETAPFFFWSGSNYFTDNAQTLRTVGPTDLDLALNQILTKEQTEETSCCLSSYMNEIDSTPEILTIYVQPELHTVKFLQDAKTYSETSGGKFSNLKSSVSNSASSVSGIYSIADITKIEKRIKSYLSKNGSVQIIADQPFEVFSNIKKQIKSISSSKFIQDAEQSSIFSNGKTDIVIVVLSEDSDNTVGEIQKIVSSKTNGNYVSLFTTDYTQVEVEANPANFFSHQLMAEAGSNCTNCTAPVYVESTYWTGVVLEALLTVFFLVFVVVVGICCICQIQVPERYEENNKTFMKVLS